MLFRSNRSTANRLCEKADRKDITHIDMGSAPNSAASCTILVEQIAFEAGLRPTDEHRGFIHLVREFLENRLSAAEAHPSCVQP